MIFLYVVFSKDKYNPKKLHPRAARTVNLSNISKRHVASQITHFLHLVLAAWCASRPSESVFKFNGSMADRHLSPPNHLTSTVPSHTPLTIFLETSFPGQAGKPFAGPQTKSPSLN